MSLRSPRLLAVLFARLVALPADVGRARLEGPARVVVAPRHGRVVDGPAVLRGRVEALGHRDAAHALALRSSHARRASYPQPVPFLVVGQGRGHDYEDAYEAHGCLVLGAAPESLVGLAERYWAQRFANAVGFETREL